MSVRSEREVPDAVKGGADIIDAKDPRHGTLGAVSSHIISDIVRGAGKKPVSVAIGDLAVGKSPAQFEPLVARAAENGVTYVKVGMMPGLSPSEQANALGAVRRAGGNRIRTIVTVYAEFLDVMHLEALFRTARAQAVDGLLLDTAIKDGRRLPDVVSWAEVRSWVREVHAFGFRAAIAGSLRHTDMRQACATRADVIGVRGAVCDRGRLGRVSLGRVAVLRESMEAATSISSFDRRALETYRGPNSGRPE